MPLQLRSPAFEHTGTIPRRHTCDGENVSPPLEWSGAPSGTKTFMLVCNDPDAPGDVFQHWVAYNIPGDWSRLEEGYGPDSLDPGFMHALNSFGKPGYGGPCPPEGDEPHAYHFRLTALSDRIEGAAQTATFAEVQALAISLEIGFTELIGYYGR